MAGFINGGQAYGGSVVSRRSKSGWVWSFRVARHVPGACEAPACFCVPFGSRCGAVVWCRQVAVSLGWVVSVRPAKRCASAWEVKVVLPGVFSAKVARALLPPMVAA